MSSSSAAARRKISLRNTIPCTSSLDSPSTGNLPCIMIGISSRTLSTVQSAFTVVITIPGVMTSLTYVSRSLSKLVITFSSSSSIDPSASPISASATSSSRETVSCSASGNILRMTSMGTTAQISMSIRNRSKYALGTDSDFQ